MKNALPIIIVLLLLAVAIWFIFKKVLPKVAENKKVKEAAKKEAALTNYEAAATVDFINSLPKRF